MKYYLLAVFSLMVVCTVFSQNTNINYKYAVKLYNLTSYEDFSIVKNDTTSIMVNNKFEYANLKILNPTFAIQWKTKKNNFKEIELTSFTINKLNSKHLIVNDTAGTNKPVNEEELKTTFISLRYEYILNINKLKEKKYLLSVGFGINPYYKLNKYIPVISSTFPNSVQVIGTNVFVTPRLTYFVSQKVFVDINIPLCIWSSYLLTENDKNPALPVSAQSTSSLNFEQFPTNFSFRVGVGIKL